jgi:hypothetical protein
VRDSQLSARLAPGHAASLDRLLAGRSLDVDTRTGRRAAMARFATMLIAARAGDSGTTVRAPRSDDVARNKSARVVGAVLA